MLYVEICFFGLFRYKLGTHEHALNYEPWHLPRYKIGTHDLALSLKPWHLPEYKICTHDLVLSLKPWHLSRYICTYIRPRVKCKALAFAEVQNLYAKPRAECQVIHQVKAVLLITFGKLNYFRPLDMDSPAEGNQKIDGLRNLGPRDFIILSEFGVWEISST